MLSDGTHYTRFTCRVKTRKELKPYVPDKGYRDQGPVLTEAEEMKRGEAGDPLLPSQMVADNDKSKYEYKLWTVVQEKAGDQMVEKKVHFPATSGMTSSKYVRDTEAGCQFINNVLVQQRYDILEEEILLSLPPTREVIEETVDGRIKTPEPMRTYTVIKIQDRFNLKFLGVQANARACWNTINHTANLEHQEFHKILDDPNLQAKLSYNCYHKIWHKEYGDFNSTKYVICIVKTFVCSEFSFHVTCSVFVFINMRLLPKRICFSENIFCYRIQFVCYV